MFNLRKSLCIIYLLTTGFCFAQDNKPTEVDNKVKTFCNVELSVNTTSKYVLVKAQYGLINFVKVYETVSPNPAQKKYIFTGPPGKYFISIFTFDEKSGISEVNKIVYIDNGEPQPEPIPTPQPTPPKPVDNPNVNPQPPPAPNPVVLPEFDKWELSTKIPTWINEGNKPVILKKSKQIGELYEIYGNKLGNGDALTVVEALNSISSEAKKVLTDEDRVAWSNFNHKINSSLSEVFKSGNKDIISMWLIVVGQTLKGVK